MGNTNTISTTLSTYISNNNYVNVSLTLIDTIIGCSVSSDSNFVFNNPPFISLDTTNNNPNSSTYYDTIAHGFNGCNPTNGYVTLTFENSNFAIGNQNIDSLVFHGLIPNQRY